MRNVQLLFSFSNWTRTRNRKAIAIPVVAIILAVAATIFSEAAERTSAVHHSYTTSAREAMRAHKMLAINFRQPEAAHHPANYDAFGSAAVVADLPLDAASSNGTVLLQHPEFAELHGGPGLVIIDFQNVGAPYYRKVVTALPAAPGKYYSGINLFVAASLPPGTLTQRSLIYALRVHPERPASTQGQCCPALTAAAGKHSDYQASCCTQGHFGPPKGGGNCEIVAESWANENLMEACADCVWSWRQSPGHWGAARSWHARYGYDITRGRNGIWYATGIFAD
jgi:hypothetical protein